MEFVQIEKKNIKFKEIDNLLLNIDLFEKYSFKKNSDFCKKNQLFIKESPPIELARDIIYNILNKDLNDNIYYEFSKKILKARNATEKINKFITELKKYYLKCKHKKYLENLNEKKIITLFRQILKPYEFNIKSIEKYENGEKFLLYIIEKKKNIIFKKINSVVNFD